MEQMTFREWLKYYGIEESWEKCSVCEGIGVETCPECGNETACIECEGKGKISLSLMEYDRICRVEKKLIEQKNEER